MNFYQCKCCKDTYKVGDVLISYESGKVFLMLRGCPIVASSKEIYFGSFPWVRNLIGNDTTFRKAKR